MVCLPLGTEALKCKEYDCCPNDTETNQSVLGEGFMIKKDTDQELQRWGDILHDTDCDQGHLGRTTGEKDEGNGSDHAGQGQ